MSTETELIKQRIKLSEFIAPRYTSLKHKANREYLGLCPFHNEKTPSFTVSDHKNFYHCFGCGEHGDLFSFYMKVENISYIEALKQLASVAQVELKDFAKQHKEEQRKNLFFQIYSQQSKLYQKYLYDNAGQAAYHYLKKRGLTDKTIQYFQLGFSPDYVNIAQQLATQFNEQALLDSKALRKKNVLYDIFAERLIFPIHNRHGNIIGFGGRLLKDSEQAPKYLNSADSTIFHKGQALYNLHDAIPHIIKQKTAIIVEGYMDVITLHQHGISNAVAPLGTSLRLLQLEILWQLCDTIICCMDGDTAGIRSMSKLAHELLPNIGTNKYIKFCVLPKAQDPDEYINKNGKHEFNNMLVNAYGLADFILKLTLPQFQLSIPEERAALQNKLLETANTIKDPILRKEFAFHFKSKYWEHIKKKQNHIPSTPSNIRSNALPLSPEHELISLLVGQPQLLTDHNTIELLAQIQIVDKNLDIIRNHLLSLDSLGEEISTIKIIESLHLKNIDFSMINKQIERFTNASLNKEVLFQKVFAKLQLSEINNEIAALKAKLQTNGNEEDFKKLSHFIKLRGNLKKKII